MAAPYQPCEPGQVTPPLHPACSHAEHLSLSPVEIIQGGRPSGVLRTGPVHSQCSVWVTAILLPAALLWQLGHRGWRRPSLSSGIHHFRVQGEQTTKLSPGHWDRIACPA